MKEFGVVTRSDRDKIEVKVDRRSACGDCRACGMTEQEREHVFELANTVGAGVGDTVVLEMKAKGFLRAVSILYGVPLIALIVGVAAGSFISKFLNEAWNPSVLGALGGLVAVCAAFLGVAKYEKIASKNRTYTPVVTGFKEDEDTEDKEIGR